MATKTLKSSGGDYSTIDDWLASLPATLTEQESLEVYDFNLNVGANSVSINKTTSATKYIRIYAASGQGHDGRPRAVSGAGFRIQSSVAGPAFDIKANHVRIEGFEIYNSSSSGSSQAFSCMNFTFASGSDVRLERMMLSDTVADTSYTANVSRADLNLTLRNCIVFGNRRTIDTRNATSVVIENCTFWRHAAQLGVVADTELTCKNTYSGHTGAASEDFWTGGSAPTGNNNASSDTSQATDYTSGVSSVAGADVFISVTAGSEDFRLKTGTNALVDAGATLGSVTTDAIGTSRPQGASYDIGAIERSSSTTLSISGAGGIASTSALGSPTLTRYATVSISDAGGVASTSALGSPVVSVAGQAIIAGAGCVASTSALGTPVLTRYATVSVSGAGGIDSSSALGTPVVTSGLPANSFQTPPIRNNTNTLLASETDVVVNVYNATTGALIVRKTGLTSDSAGKVIVTDAAMTSASIIAYEVVLSGDRRRLPTATVT